MKFLPRTSTFEKELVKITLSYSVLMKENDGYLALWEAAILRKDGMGEGKQRQMMHNVLDQLLDTRQQSLQLCNEFKEGL